MLGNLSSAKMLSAKFLKLAFSSIFFQRILSGLQNPVPVLKGLKISILTFTQYTLTKYMSLALEKRSLMHVHKVWSQISRCSLHRLIKDETLRIDWIFV